LGTRSLLLGFPGHGRALPSGRSVIHHPVRVDIAAVVIVALSPPTAEVSLLLLLLLRTKDVGMAVYVIGGRA